VAIRKELTDFIRALSRQDWEEVDRILAKLDEEGWTGGAQTISAAFAIAVHRRFHPDDDVRKITRFVADVRNRYEEGRELPALEMEGMIRAALGETDLAENIDGETALSTQIALLAALLEDEALTGDSLEDYIRDVETTAARFM